LGKRGRQSPRRLRRRQAFQGISNAFRWLTEKGSRGHKVEWLGGYPLLIAGSPRNAFLAFEFLCRPSEQEERSTVAIGPMEYVAMTKANGSALGSSLKGGFVTLTYLESPRGPGVAASKSLLEQQDEVRQLFREKYRSEHVLAVRSDNLQSNGDNSIKESITNLICAEYFMSKGYMVMADCGSGPDLIAFKSKLVDQLRERRLIGQGASVSQLATIRAFGRDVSSCLGSDVSEEVIAVESESVNPRNGVMQLRNGYDSDRFSYMGFFDRRVLAAPFLSQRKRDLDVFSYDLDGIEYWRCDEDRLASNFWRGKKLQFLEEIHESIRAMLLMNLTRDEVAHMVSAESLTTLATLREAMKLETDKIIDAVENCL
jgi:hypothetical protein